MNKLRGMCLSEAIGRGRQEFVKLADRFLIASAGEMSDKALYQEFTTTMRNGSGQGTAEALRERLRTGSGAILPHFAERRAIIEMMERRFPAEREAIIASAEKSIAGRLDLLGFTDLDFGQPIDWRLNPLTHDLAPLVHWSKIDPVVPIGKGDLKVFWEVQRNMHFVTLGQAYWLTGDHRYAEAFVNQASSWIEANPVGMGVG
ncbi:MAG: heparinase II/III family protein, partial [Blastocatellia bacterium]